MKSRRLKSIFLLLGAAFLGLTLPCWSTELDPWFSDEYLLVFRPNVTYERFHHIATSHGLTPYTAHNKFFVGRLQTSPSSSFNVEAEWGWAATKNSSFGIEYYRTTGRYLLMSDVGGEDPVSMAVGATFTFPWRYRLRDINLIHHSLYDTEVHLSIGKEVPCGPFWSERYWMLFGIGQGSRGAPWIRGIIAAEKNFKDIHRFRLSLEYLRGLGNHSIRDVDHFQGYANIRHQSLDFIFHYIYSIPTFFDITLDYVQRISASNCPQGVQAASIGIVWPLSVDELAGRQCKFTLR
jgi:hypothetical protein